MTSSSVPVHESSEPSCVPLMPGRQHNTARPRHNFPILPLLCSKLLISEASYIRYYAMCFSVVYFSGPCTLMGLGAGCWWLRLLLTFTCSWMEPPAPLLLSGSVHIKPKQANGRLGWRDHRYDAHVSQKVWRKQGTRADGETCLSVTAQHGSSWSWILSAVLFWVFWKHRTEKQDSQAIWCDMFPIWTHTVCFGLSVFV